MTEEQTTDTGRGMPAAPMSPMVPWGQLTPDQIAQLLKPIHPSRVSKDRNGYSHVEGYEQRAHLNRLFGFARWSGETTAMELVFESSEEKNGRTGWTAAYRAQYTLTIHSYDGAKLATYIEWAMGDARNQPVRAEAHDLAVKMAETQALKRAASNLGDQFGLGLYNGGSMAPLVRGLVSGETTGPAVQGESAVNQPSPELAPEGTLPPTVERETSSLPPNTAATPPAAPEQSVDEMTQAQEVIEEMMPGATAEPSGDLGDKMKAVEEVTEMVRVANTMAGSEKLQKLGDALELSVRAGIRQHRLANGMTVGAALTKMLGETKA